MERQQTRRGRCPVQVYIRSFGKTIKLKPAFLMSFRANFDSRRMIWSKPCCAPVI